ncbi:MAG: hypothetical protein AAFX06_20555 [Planctomycetota bacterium]
MKKICDFIEASATMVDRRLEPTDETTYLITLKNKSNLYTAANVVATIGLVGGAVDGIKVTPDDRFFGTIPPKKSVTKEISILTERVDEGDYRLCYHLNFSAMYEKCEGEETTFEVVKD